ncbi:hypothetical protein K439DRAFT_1641635 [Ramaria rubella]|nr:hypothetical protein K439DRAFT_1641635 [Ramaria rubella]
MPAAKVQAKAVSSEEKSKRKRVEFDGISSMIDVSTDKPPKKLRQDDGASSTLPATKRRTKKPSAAKALKSTQAETSGEPEAKDKKISKRKATIALQLAISPTGEKASKTRGPQLSDTAIPNDIAGDKMDREGSEGETREEEIHLQGFSSESDSSDEELDATDAPPLDLSTLPSFSKDEGAVQRILEKAKKHPTEDKGVIYLGRIPHGFYEDQMRTYFSQFGEVTRLRLSRNKKTGRSKHYAFIEFRSSEVADIVGETMNNYLLLGHILQCKIIPKDEVHPELWIGANKKWRFVPRDRIARVKQNKLRTPEEQRRAESRLLARQKKKQDRILASGIKYDFQEVAYKPKISDMD